MRNNGCLTIQHRIKSELMNCNKQISYQLDFISYPYRAITRVSVFYSYILIFVFMKWILLKLFKGKSNFVIKHKINQYLLSSNINPRKNQLSLKQVFLFKFQSEAASSSGWIGRYIFLLKFNVSLKQLVLQVQSADILD